MIRTIKISNFKSHLNTEMSLSNLNLITGMNGVGKSSLIQSLLLLRQSYEKDRLAKLHLVGDLYTIGAVDDAIAMGADKDQINYNVIFGDDINLNLNFTFDSKKNELENTYLEREISILPELDKLSLFNNSFQYISAFRNGPLDFYPVDTDIVKNKRQISNKEGKAELIAHFIAEFGKIEIPIKELAYPDIPSNPDLPDSKIKLLEDEINHWMAGISKNVKVHVLKIGNTSYKIEYSYSRIGKLATKRFSAKNVGFGVSYDLPIITALLSASPGDLLIIENPEAHIHPSGQSKLMELICKAAENGVQIIIETHSDHVINGTLVACKKEFINHENISIYYFDRDEEEHSTKVNEIRVEKNGKIRRPPEGFFNQIDIDMKALMGF